MSFFGRRQKATNAVARSRRRIVKQARSAAIRQDAGDSERQREGAGRVCTASR